VQQRVPLHRKVQDAADFVGGFARPREVAADDRGHADRQRREAPAQNLRLLVAERVQAIGDAVVGFVVAVVGPVPDQYR
jgi:hypothetical protein